MHGTNQNMYDQLRTCVLLAQRILSQFSKLKSFISFFSRNQNGRANLEKLNYNGYLKAAFR